MAHGHRFEAAVKRESKLAAQFAELLRRDFAPVEPAAEGDYDFRTPDGRYVIGIKHALLSARDLHAALLRLVFVLDGHPEIERSVLVASFPRMSTERLRSEWKRFEKPLQPSVAHRLGLVAMAADGDLAVPDEPRQSRLLFVAREVFHQEPLLAQTQPVPRKWSAKTFEVWKVLLGAWLNSEGLLPIQEIAQRSGCSRPTVNGVFELLSSRKELARGKNRSGGLAGLPRASLREVLVLANDLRLTSRFVDGSGRRPEPVGLVRRLNDKKPAGIAFGGVVAARHYQPDFDLNGLPRVDLTLHGDRPLTWLSALDPALRRADSDETAPVLVVHRLLRPADRFTQGPTGAVPCADPAEVLLDLYDLGLPEQAANFVRFLHTAGNAHV